MGQTYPPEVTLSIVSHGDAEKVERLLGSLSSCEKNIQFQVILTDNLGNNLPTFDGFAKIPLTLIRNQRPRGFASNHNQAFRMAKTNYFCVLNPDVFFEQEVFGNLIALLDTAKADIVAPLILDPGGIVQDSFRILPTPLNIVRRKLPGYRFAPIPAGADGMVRPDWMAGTFLLMKRETFAKMGGFNEKFYLYFEDVDLCTRARLAGLKLLVDTSVHVQHLPQHASRKNFRYLLWHFQSALRFFLSTVYTQALQNKPTLRDNR
jgi:N-acetylglucosaminyl-diphospho-decaprenol L-rhamnosyltransferase